MSGRMPSVADCLRGEKQSKRVVKEGRATRKEGNSTRMDERPAHHLLSRTCTMFLSILAAMSSLRSATVALGLHCTLTARGRSDQHMSDANRDGEESAPLFPSLSTALTYNVHRHTCKCQTGASAAQRLKSKDKQ